jgi:hypothetical protein
MVIREAGRDDWHGIWAFMHRIAAAGETFAWDPAIDEEQARARWCHSPPGRTFVASMPTGRFLARPRPNRTARVPAHTWRPRASWSTQTTNGAVSAVPSASRCWTLRAPTAIGRCSSTPSPRRTLPPSRSGARAVSRCSPRCRKPSATPWRVRRAPHHVPPALIARVGGAGKLPPARGGAGRRR